MQSIFRYKVPVDDQWHTVHLRGVPLSVAARQPDVVEIWASYDDKAPEAVREFRVFGTGHPLPDGRLDYIGTAMAAGGSLVWHLMERPSVVAASNGDAS
jgi:hypothetical protein